jgi:hypothetical protein
MAKKKLKPRELSALQDAYLAKREELLVKKVNGLSVKLFDKVYNNYLTALEQSGGRLVLSDRNVSMVRGLDSIFAQFNREDNIPVIKYFVNDLKSITPITERYFETLTGNSAAQTSARVAQVIDRRLGLDAAGEVVAGGFTDKIIKSYDVLNKIKKRTTKAITNKMGIQEFRDEMKTFIQGDEKANKNGLLQQYYRNHAYDTYVQVDRANNDMFAKDLGLRYFYWTGGVINTTRHICEKCNGMILDSLIWNKVKFEDLKPYYQDGMDKNSNPKDDLGGYGCRHRKRYILTSIAEAAPNKIIDINNVLLK